MSEQERVDRKAIWNEARDMVKSSPLWELHQADVSESRHTQIRFKGKEWILVDGAITTPGDFASFECSYAHIMDDGRIMRFGKQIGCKADIEYLPPKAEGV